jgi:hypothetical protein
MNDIENVREKERKKSTRKGAVDLWATTRREGRFG